MNELNRYAYSSANMFPLKVLLHPPLDGTTILPRHVQLNPTNRCQFKCDYCSCSGRDRKHELSLGQIKDTMRMFQAMGCQAVTITGGGEPLMHKDIQTILLFIYNLNIEIGLVTNGVFLPRLLANNAFPINVLDACKWIRVSASNVLSQQLATIGLSLNEWFEILDGCVHSTLEVDWAFSYVVSPENTFNENLLRKLVTFAETNNFTHVRVVHDILNAGILSSPVMPESPLINYQPRTEYTPGSNPCYLSLLKPVVGADGYIYPCCGVQYALPNPSRDYEHSMRMGHIDDLPTLFYGHKYFDGSKCVRCFYSQYNMVLKALREGLPHEKFM